MYYTKFLLIFLLFFSHILSATDNLNLILKSISNNDLITLEVLKNDTIATVKTKLSEKIKLDEYQELVILQFGKVSFDETLISEFETSELINFVVQEKKISINVEIFGSKDALSGLNEKDFKWTIKVPKRAKDASKVVQHAADLLNFPHEYIQVIHDGKKLDCKDVNMSDLLSKKAIYLYLNTIDEEKQKEINRQLVPVQIILRDTKLFADFAHCGGTLLKEDSPETSFELFVTNDTSADYIKNKIYQQFGWDSRGYRTKISLLVNGDDWEDDKCFFHYNKSGSSTIAVILQLSMSYDLKIILNRYNSNTNEEEFYKEFTYSYNGQLTVKKLKDYLVEREKLVAEKMKIIQLYRHLENEDNYVLSTFAQNAVHILVNNDERVAYYENKEINEKLEAFERVLTLLYSLFENKDFFKNEGFFENRQKITDSKNVIDRILSYLEWKKYEKLEILQKRYNKYLSFENGGSQKLLERYGYTKSANKIYPTS